jgi:hypothetical protein
MEGLLYQRLLQDEKNDHKGDLEVQEGEPSLTTPHRRSRARPWTYAASNIFIHGTLFVLLVTNIVLTIRITQHQSLVETHKHSFDHSQTVLQTYGDDERYMSLDGKYDYLWDDLVLPSTAVVRLPNDKDGGVTGGTISM